MKITEIQLIYSYLISCENRLNVEVKELTQTLRYRRIDAVDCFELALLMERYGAFCEFSKDIRKLLKL